MDLGPLAPPYIAGIVEAVWGSEGVAQAAAHHRMDRHGGQVAEGEEPGPVDLLVIGAQVAHRVSSLEN